MSAPVIRWFLDAFQRYQQIFMAEEDMEKNSFVTEYGIYFWKVLAFGLENVGTTYHRIVNKVFSTQIGRNMDIYVDDMLIKSREARDHESNLRESFENLRKYNLGLNPDKCVLGLISGKFLGYMISQRGIEPNPDKIVAVQVVQSTRTLKEAQRLTRQIEALTRFISRASDRSFPFFKVINKGKEFERTEDCEQSFHELKAYLQSQSCWQGR
ncbi:hypothetical protein LIER_14140 [Lithospermum erythrorhizon]|uniref:Reverse transcriptase domain-containing protein n=1 Tax=Lithospermum erythrorhizon TaxID=34254 RepID=A0AAV3PZ12_LITER